MDHNWIEVDTTPTKLIPEQQIAENIKTPVKTISTANKGQTLFNTVQKATRRRNKFQQQQTCQVEQVSEQTHHLECC